MALLAVALTLVAPQPGALAEAKSIQDVFAPGLKDLSLTARRKQVNLGELNKISRDYANAYRVGDSHIQMKEPGYFRLDTKVGPFKVIYIIAGTRKATRAPFVNDSREIGSDPGKRQGPLEVGLITSGTLNGYKVEHVGCSVEGGRPACQYRLRYAHDPERYDLITVDTERKCLIKRQLWTQMHGKYKMELTFQEPRKVGSLWVPTRVEVRNAEGKLAGVTEQTDIQVNTGLADSLFKI